MIRVRFAPSPTGYLHVGGARTALFNWLLARRYGGTFVLRIEDTDTERSSAEMVDGILEGLTWLGLDWDEGPKVGGSYGPYFQTERQDRHRAMVERLVTGGHAYYCYCAPETIKEQREAAEREGRVWRYDRRCDRLSKADIAERERQGMPRAVRFRVPEGTTRFDDLVHGPIEIEAATIEDFILLRSDGHPTYQLSVVSDDVEMEITHVVRGDDHISNTPKQLLLYEAVGAPAPAFAHVPLILGPDKKRLSKRHGATSVMEYERQGYMPEAMVNFLALLGWSPGNDRELFTKDELVAAFDLRGISGGGPVFNQEKLDWFNQQHLFRLSLDDLAVRLRPLFEGAGVWDASYLDDKRAWFSSVLELIRPRASRLGDFLKIGRFFFTEDLDYDQAAVAKHVRQTDMAGHIAAVDAAFAELAPFDPPSIEATLRAIADVRAVKAPTLIHAVRVAVTGKAASPGLFEVVALLGRDRTRARLTAAIRLAAQA